ncbi:MAG: outer membrane beta-barrel protein [Chitinophagaceae bacterium]
MNAENVRLYPGVVIMVMVICFAGHYVNGQVRITGKVMKDGNDPLANANVLILRSKDSSLVRGTISDKNGLYTFQNVFPGQYLVSITFTGLRQTYIAPFSLSNDDHNKNLGETVLSRSLVDLKGVHVVARKPLFEQKIDRMVINVSSSITYAGGTALEVLERSPGVLVNQQNNTLSMNGKDGVVIMINNKINRMPISAIIQMLEGLSANSIERIELIASPPSNLDSEGNAGFINIVLKSTTESGTNGSYAATAGFSRGENTQVNLNLNHRKSVLNLFGDLSFSRILSQSNWDVYKMVMYQGKTKETYLNVNRPAVQLLYNGRFGADYTLSDKTIVGFLLSAYSNQQSREWNNQGILLIDYKVDTNLVMRNKEINNWSNISGNLNLQHAISKDEKVSINFNYDYYFSNNPLEYSNAYYDGDMNFTREHRMEGFKKTPLNIWVMSADYSKKLSDQVNMEAGLKETWSGFINETLTNNLLPNGWQKDELFSSTYNLHENILAGYLSFTTTFNKRTTIKSGLRYEHTTSNLDSEKKKNIIDRSYGNFFPSVFLSHGFNEHDMVNFAYSRRITRPSFNNLAPTTAFIDPYTYFYGNPYLQPSISNTLTGSYTYRRKIMSMSYSHESKPITNYFPKVEAATNIQSLAAENQKNLITITSGISIPFSVAKWWAGQMNLTATHQEMNVYLKGTVTGLKQQYVTATLSQTFILPHDISFETSGTFNSGGFFGIFIRKPYGGLNAGVQKKFPGTRSSLRLSGVNILNTQAANIHVNMPENNLVTRFKCYFSYPGYRLTYTRNFGNDKLTQVRKRATGAEDVKQRVE